MFVRNKLYKGPVQSVVLDWAGTAVDHGCIGPAAVFVDVFAEHSVYVSVADARRFMGLAKIDHIRSMCSLPSIASAWEEKHGCLPDEKVVSMLYERTAHLMVETISNHSNPISGVIDTIEALKDMGIRIGSSTGYVKEMMDVLVPIARDKGYSPDAVFCSSDVPAGRPYPWMCYLNAVKLQTYPMEAMVKIGDTIADIEEGLNAGMWTIGITRTGNELGLSEDEVDALAPETLKKRLNEIEKMFRDAGVHYTVEQTADVIPVIQEINQRLKSGEMPVPFNGK